ncbi:hypothetical protein D9611_005996 [Ephemerocybe angulata]|uniref:MYND-type domain-containing protein n=1 Tax=Ephemerocybe angulata TaxID=980116 RepID=A0A8H5CHV3_9AGAR|nr:hypothetical protein D9611_005996 [Tulosesus angulatus]
MPRNRGPGINVATAAGPITVSLQNMRRLQEAVESNRCSLSDVEMILASLKWDFVPQVEDWPQASQLERSRAETATSSVMLLQNITRAIASDVDWREDAVEKVIESVGGICRWVAFCLRLRFVGTTSPFAQLGCSTKKAWSVYTAVLENLLISDVRIRSALLSTPELVDLVIDTWRMEERGVPIIELELDTCPGTVLLCRTVGPQESGLDLLVQRLTAGHGKRSMFRFLECTIRRVRQVCKAARTFEIGYKRLQDIFAILGALLGSSAGSWIWTLLRKLEFAREAMFGLIDLSGKADCSIHTLLEPISTLFRIVTVYSDRTVSTIGVFLANPTFRGLYLTAVTSIPPSDEEASQNAEETLSLITFHAVYPSLLAHILNLREEGRRYICGDNPPLHWHTGNFKTTWDSFFLQVSRFSVPMQMVDSLTICDNPMCLRWQARAETSRQSASRQCSGCSSMVYCCEECQKEDWNGLHREECKSASIFHTRTKSVLLSYGHKTRQFHTNWAAWLYGMLEEKIDEARLKMHPGYTAQEAVPHFDEKQGLSRKNEMTFINPTVNALWVNVGNIKTPQVWLKPRIAKMVGDYREGRLAPDVRLMQAMFAVGINYTAVLLVAVRKGEAGRWRGEYGVLRLMETPWTPQKQPW